MPRALIRFGGARRGANAPSRHRSPLLQVPRAQGGDRPGGGHPRRNKDGDGRTSVHNALAVIRTATQPAQRRRLSPEPQVPRALIWRGRNGSPQVPRALTRGAAPGRPECRMTGSTPQRQGTPRRQPIPLPAPNIIKQDPVVFHKSSVGLNEGGQRLSATPLTSPTEPSPGLGIFRGWRTSRSVWYSG